MVTFLLICNLTMWVIYTFEVQKVLDSPIQVTKVIVILFAPVRYIHSFQSEFFGFHAWTLIQKVTLPLCIFFRFHSTVILAEIWKNTYKTKLCD